MTQEEQFIADFWNFHLASDPWLKDAFREKMVYEIKSCRRIHIFLRELCSASYSPHMYDDGIDVLKQIDSELLEIYLRYTTEDIENHMDPLYILIGAAGRHEHKHIFREEILNHIHAFSLDIRLAVAEALYEMGDIETVEEMLKEECSNLVREGIEELFE